jgi:hypothetical protein
MSSSHTAYHLSLLLHLRSILQAVAEAEQIPEESHELFLQRYDRMLEDLQAADPVALADGQELLVQVFHRYPQIAHLLPRDLLWFFAGECLHYLDDAEVRLYQCLDERRHEAEQEGESFDWLAEREALLLELRGD